jgi:hypothetical protein
VKKIILSILSVGILSVASHAQSLYVGGSLGYGRILSTNICKDAAYSQSLLNTKTNNDGRFFTSVNFYKTAVSSFVANKKRLNNTYRIHSQNYGKAVTNGVYLNVNLGLGYSALPTYKYGYIQSSTSANTETSPTVKDFTIRGIGPMVDVAFYPISNKKFFLGIITKGGATYLPGINSSQHSAFLDLGIRGGVGGNGLKVIGEYSLKKRWAEYRYSLNDESSSLSTSSLYHSSVDVMMRRIAFGVRFGDETTEATYLEVRYFLDKIYLDEMNNLSKGVDLTIHVRNKIDVGFEISKRYIRTGNIMINQPYDDERKKTTGLFMLFSIKKSLDFGR